MKERLQIEYVIAKLGNCLSVLVETTNSDAVEVMLSSNLLKPVIIAVNKGGAILVENLL